MKRLVIAGALVLGALAYASPAFATGEPNGYTTGNETYQTNDGKGFGPIPYGPEWVEECKTIKFDPPDDPPSFVKVTVHNIVGGEQDGYHVVNYNHLPGQNYDTDGIEDLVAGKQGHLNLSWNIGSGLTHDLAYDCRPPTEGPEEAHVEDCGVHVALPVRDPEDNKITVHLFNLTANGTAIDYTKDFGVDQVADLSSVVPPGDQHIAFDLMWTAGTGTLHVEADVHCSDEPVVTPPPVTPQTPAATPPAATPTNSSSTPTSLPNTGGPELLLGALGVALVAAGTTTYRKRTTA